MQLLLLPEDLELYLGQAKIFGDCLKEIRKFLLKRQYPVSSGTIRRVWKELVFYSELPTLCHFPFGEEKNSLGEKFPYDICISVGNCVAHGFGPEKIELGEPVTIDAGISTTLASERCLNYDSAISCVVGNTKPEPPESKCAFNILLHLSRYGKKDLTPRDISSIIDQSIAKEKMLTITSLSGHCIGYKLHQLPAIPNALYEGHGYEPFVKGVLINPEPMVARNSGSPKNRIATTWLNGNGWTVETTDSASHWETTFLYDGFNLHDVVGITEINL